MKKTIALVGNPNCGKSTVFNILTGSNQYVGNWPGVTVEKKSGHIRKSKLDLSVVDLPGIYSLATSTLEEVITREFIESDEVDLIVNILDASNLERNLFLTLQLMEIGKPMIVALNMMDVLRAHKDELNIEHLSQHLGIDMIEIVASKEQGISTLIEAMEKDHVPVQILPIYRPKIQKLINKVKEGLHIKVSPTLHAIRFIEEGISAALGHEKKPLDLSPLNAMVEESLRDETLDRDMIISDEKYRFITELSSHVLKRNMSQEKTLTHRIDAVVTHRILAFPIFLGVMWIVFMLAFGPFGATLKGYFELLIQFVIDQVASLLTMIDVSPWVYGLVIDGLLGGVGSVLGFLPEITILFIVLSILEDTGYMARAAFIMDRILRRFGLSGKSFIPMIIGFGCTVPALMATRTLENEKDRRLTMMIIPFMSCSARFPIYAVFAAALFTNNQALVVYTMYIMGILVAILSGIFLKRFVTQGSVSSFIMELPEYHRPTLRNLILHTWDKVKGFIIKAGTVLLLASLIIYMMSTYTFDLQPALEQVDSMIGSIGTFIAPIFKPLGFGDWKSSIALLVGFIAKEAVVSTLGVLHGVGDSAVNGTAALVEPIRAAYTPLAGFAFMTFTLLYLPCIAAFATLKREMNSWKWTFITVGYQTGVAYLLALLIYQGGKMMGF
ncbi:MAG: ferrous iron transporter FeoB [Erysipelotrichaceae bacterium]|nr:MAG: ferrous iron transporter [Erysipelotrichaceae bacterium]TXT18384.1 MAG: ferrous iron transporter FeoB [Erysipelotrichaceae bacterium]